MDCCKECEHWGKAGEYTWRGCSKLHLNKGDLWRDYLDEHNEHLPSLKTPSGFACDEFKPKPKGPFHIERHDPKCRWFVVGYFPNHRAWIYRGSEYNAERIATFLNEQWERRE